MEAGKFMDFCKVANNLFDKICTEFDTIWQKRKRVLSSKVLVLFILKLVLSKNKQGYGRPSVTVGATRGHEQNF